jgi:uncharacterized protein YuzE
MNQTELSSTFLIPTPCKLRSVLFRAADAAKVAPDLILDYDASGNVIGLTVEHANERGDLTSLPVMRVPPLAA